MPDVEPSRLRVVVGVASYRRPQLLATLLPQLVAQTVSLRHEARVVVVDNDPRRSARSVVEGFAGSGVGYAVEPTPGIAAARNRAVDEAADADLLVFIDDDEEPGPDWLRALVDAWSLWRCAAVAGPVVSHFEAPVDDWVQACSAFRRPRRPTGTELPGAATNNLLLDLAFLRRVGVRFDERFGLTGGEDTLLTRSLVRHGGRIRWCDEAVVLEQVPRDRATRSWVLHRRRRTGNIYLRVALALAPTRRARLRTRAEMVLRASYRLLRGATATALGRVTGDVARRSEGESEVATATGVLLAAIGRVVTGYARTPTA